MRSLQRLLVFAGKVAIVIYGFVASCILAIAGDPNVGADGWAVLALVLFLGLAAFVLLRRRVRAWRTEYEVADWNLAKAARTAHPVRARYRRLAGGMLVGRQA